MGWAWETGTEYLWGAAALAVGFPIVLLILNELLLRAERRKRPNAATFRLFRNLVAPSLALLLFLKFVLRVDSTSTPLRLVETGFWICLLFAVLTLVNDVVFRSASPGNWRERVPSLLRDLARFVVVCFGAAIIYSQVWGQEIGGALTALGIGSIVIGLALQEPLGNIVSGLMLLFERPFNIGDWVTADGVTGKVIEINWRSVHIETSTRELRIVPNVSLYKGAFSNLSRPTPLRTEQIELGFSADHPPNQVKDMLLHLVQDCPGVLADPRPSVRTIGYADNSIRYRVSFTVSRQEKMGEVRDLVLTRLWYAAKRAGLVMPIPTVANIALPPRDEAIAKVPPLTERLEEVPLLRGRAGKLTNLADTKLRSYAAGEIVVKQGLPLDGLFLVLKGTGVLSIQGENQEVHEFGHVAPGDYFGEYGVMAGQKSEITVTAQTDLDTVVLGTQTVLQLFDQNPRIAAEIGNTIEARRKAMSLAKKARV